MYKKSSDCIYSFRIPKKLMLRFRDLPYYYRSSFKLARLFRCVVYKLVSEADLPAYQLTDISARIILKQWEHEYLIKEIEDEN